MSAGVRVFSSASSAHFARALMCLFEKNVEFDLIRVYRFRGPKLIPQHLQQPNGEALTFIDGDTTLVESMAIVRHIADKYSKQGNTDLIGTGALERACIEQWLQMEEHAFDGPSAEMVYSLAKLPPNMPPYMPLPVYAKQGNQDQIGTGDQERTSIKLLPPAVQQVVQDMLVQDMKKVNDFNEKKNKEMQEMCDRFNKSKKELDKVLDIYDLRLQQSAHLAGDKFTIADLCHLPIADSILADDRSRCLLKSHENVSRWWDDISTRKTWMYVKKLLLEEFRETLTENLL